MRGTLHALPAVDYPLYVAALRGRAHMWRPSWLRAFGLTAEDLAAVLAAIPQALDGQALTREALAAAVEARTDAAHLGKRLRSGWGELLKPAAYAGALCFGPPDGSAVTFVRPDQWLAGAPGGAPAGEDAPDDPTAALAALLRRFLAAYGPATVDDFAHWWGSTTIGPIRAAFAALGAEVVPVAVEGWAASALASTLPAMQAAVPEGVVRLLPGFDPYVITLYHQPGVLDRALWPRVSRTSGWISPVLLVDGRLAGVWRSQRTRGRLAVTITAFAPVAPEVVAGAAAEAERLGAFLDAPVDVTWEPPAPA